MAGEWIKPPIGLELVQKYPHSRIHFLVDKPKYEKACCRFGREMDYEGAILHRRVKVVLDQLGWDEVDLSWCVGERFCRKCVDRMIELQNLAIVIADMEEDV